MDSNSGNFVLILILKLRSLLIISKLSILLYIQLHFNPGEDNKA